MSLLSPPFPFHVIGSNRASIDKVLCTYQGEKLPRNTYTQSAHAYCAYVNVFYMEEPVAMIVPLVIMGL